MGLPVPGFVYNWVRIAAKAEKTQEFTNKVTSLNCPLGHIYKPAFVRITMSILAGPPALRLL